MILRFFALLCLAFFATAALAEPNLSSDERRLYRGLAPSDESGDFFSANPLIPSGELALSVSEYPKKYLLDEPFAITVTARTSTKAQLDLNVSVDKNAGLDWLNPSPKWTRRELSEGASYAATLLFIARSTNAALNSITLSLNRNKTPLQQATLRISPLRFERVQPVPDYAHVVADELEVRRVRASYFDAASVIMMLELRAKNADLRGFHLAGISRQGVENLRGDLSASTGFYYAILPASASAFSFSYFNKKSQKIEKFNLHFELAPEPVATQAELNPNSQDFKIYKQYALWAVAGLLALIFVFKKSYPVLILATAALALGFVVDTKNEFLALRPGARAQILPTENSTFFYTSGGEEVGLLGRRGEYVKVLLANGQIGWVKDVDLSKN